MMIHFWDGCWMGLRPRLRNYRNGAGYRVVRIEWLKYVFELNLDWEVV